jgi:hypothetical protein
MMLASRVAALEEAADSVARAVDSVEVAADAL